MKKLLLALVALFICAAANAQVVPAPPGTAAMVCANNTVVPAPTSGQFFYVQCDSSGHLLTNAGSGLVLATSNMTFNVATTGNDSNLCTAGSPCLTLQRAVNVAGGYNWNNQYFPTINIANGTYTNTQISLPALVNCSNGGVIIGNTTTPTNVSLNDAGSAYTLIVTTNSIWTVNGISFGGTYGGFDVKSFAVLNMNQINWGGALVNIGLNVEPYGAVYVANALTQGGTLSTTASTMGVLIFNRGLVVMDAVTITFSNAITFSSYLIALDATTSFMAFIGSTFTNGSNVTATMFGLIMNNGAFFETSTTTKVDGATLSRTNFPGGATGAKVLVDGWSTFQADLTAAYATAGSVAFADTSGVVRANYSVTDSNNWTFSPVGGDLDIVSASPSSTAFQLINTSAGGHSVFFGAVGSGGLFGLAAGQLGFFDVTSGNTLFWFDLSANMTLSAGLGFSAQGSFAANAADSGISRLGAASLALGNGTAGDFSGTLKLAHLTATALANSATTSAVCYNTGTGVLTFDGTVGTCTVSDERLKNIGPRIDRALDRLLQINGFYFTWKDTVYGTGTQIGVGAQTVEKVFPELISTGSNGYKSVDYQHMIAPIIEAMRELKADNDNLRACQESWKCRMFGVR